MVEFALSEPFPFEIGEIVEQQDSDITLSKISKYLSQEVLKEIVLTAHNNIQDKAALSDRNTLGNYRQGEITLALRVYLSEYGWTLEPWSGGAFLCLSPCRTKSIIVATATSDVGRHNGMPMTTSSKGRKFEEAIRNSKLDLPDTVQFWVLLFHWEYNKVQLELSLPSGFVSHQITGYKQRIILADVDLTKIDEIERKQPVEEYEPLVERKQKAG